MDADVKRALTALRAKFGPGANGVVTIFAHKELPEVFGKKEWREWQFKPADAAFEYAHNAGFIVPHKLGSKWEFTEFGLRVRKAALAELYGDAA